MFKSLFFGKCAKTSGYLCNGAMVQRLHRAHIYFNTDSQDALVLQIGKHVDPPSPEPHLTDMVEMFTVHSVHSHACSYV